MNQIIEFFAKNNSISVLVLILIGMGIGKLLQTLVVKNLFSSIIRKKLRTLLKKSLLSLSVQKNYFLFMSKLSLQNNEYTDFLKLQILAEVTRLNTSYDLLLRYVIATLLKSNTILNNTETTISRLSKPYLLKNTAKWLMQMIMLNHISKKMLYLQSLKHKYKLDVKKDKIILDVYRVFKLITRLLVLFMDNFNCIYGLFGNPLRLILLTLLFDVFIKTKIYNVLDLPLLLMLQLALNIMLLYKLLMLSYLLSK